MTPDEVCGRACDLGVKIKVWHLEDNIVIQGTREGLLFRSDLFRAQAEADEDGSGLSPFGTGSALFAAGSTRGIYISRDS